jgi:hypothetical protein
MKNSILSILAAILTLSVFAQAPQKMSYQAVIRNSSSALITSTTVGMQISILQGSALGTPVYVETQTPTSNANGLVSLEIGTGITVDDFSAIDWSNGPYFIKTETDPTGGTNYTITGTSELLSAPYALHAKTAENITGGIIETDPVFSSSTAAGITNTDTINWNNKLSSFNEIDPLFTASPANSITNNQIIKWDSVYSWGNHQGLYLPSNYVPNWNNITNAPTGNNKGDMLYWTGTAWSVVPVGVPGQILYLNDSSIAEWQNAPISQAPSVTTLSAYNITPTSANLSGLVNANGFMSNNDFQYGTTISYGNISQANPTNSTGTNFDTITTTLNGLLPGTTYYARVRSSNAVNYSFGNDLSFSTLSTIPIVSTLNITSISSNSSTVEGSIISDGGASITDRGFCYSLSPNPTLSDNTISLGMGGIGNFNANINGLISSTTYYVKAFATNINGTVYGEELLFTTSPIYYSVNTSKSGLGFGTIQSNPSGIDCGIDCIENFAEGTLITLTASPNVGSTFAGWSGSGCSGTGNCSFTINSNQTINAMFNLNSYTLNVNKTGTGTGSVTSVPTGIDCGIDCSEIYNHGSNVTLIATATPGSTFTGWSGSGCSGTGTCIVTMDAAKTVTANFSNTTYNLTTNKAGTGVGTLTSAPAGINCGVTCSSTFESGTSITLTASPSVGSTFTGWSGGGCSGTGVCNITLNSATTVTGNFSLNTYSLTVAKSGTGSGSVNSTPVGINCGTDCSEMYYHGTNVTLTAAASAGSTFTGWSGGGCSGTGTCVVTMDAAKNVNATFEPITYTLTVTRAGAGSGTVTSAPAGINCGSTCTASFSGGTMITLTASPSSGTFTGWTGACSGTGTCTLTMDAAKSVTATFAP